MFILVVDDLRIFPDKIGDNIVYHALTSTAALKFLTENFLLTSEIFLDFDLGGTDDATSVINWLEEKAYNGEANHICAIRILTKNPVGYQRIAALAKYYFIGSTPQHIGIRKV